MVVHDLSTVRRSEPDEPGAARRERLRRLVAACRVFALLGYDEGVAGHLTARDPEHDDRFWVNPFGLGFDELRTSDLLQVDHDGNVLVGTGKLNRAAFAIHSRIHAARPDVAAVAHAHSVHGRAWAALGRPLDPITQNACVFFEDHVLFDEYSGPVFAVEEADRIAAALGGAKAAILRNHGLLTVGRSVDEAAWWFITMDRSCRVQLLAEAVAKPVLVDDAVARAAARNNGGADAGWFNFQPLYRRVCREFPEFDS
jgi:ribulose-5-phosphate 4-epimerase/fuculose-1-phosphate aldolase